MDFSLATLNTTFETENANCNVKNNFVSLDFFPILEVILPVQRKYAILTKNWRYLFWIFARGFKDDATFEVCNRNVVVSSRCSSGTNPGWLAFLCLSKQQHEVTPHSRCNLLFCVQERGEGPRLKHQTRLVVRAKKGHQERTQCWPLSFLISAMPILSCRTPVTRQTKQGSNAAF